MSNVKMHPTLKLTVNVGKNKAGDFLYQIVNRETGEVMADRRSNRIYTACTKDGASFFGRPDLAHKHSRSVMSNCSPEFLADYYVFMEDAHPGHTV
jgi:hypothetical protein